MGCCDISSSATHMLNVSSPPPPYSSLAPRAQRPAALVLAARRAKSSSGMSGASGSSVRSRGVISSWAKRRDWPAGQLGLSGPGGSLERGHGPRFYHHRGDPLIQLSPRLPARGERLSSNGVPLPQRESCWGEGFLHEHAERETAGARRRGDGCAHAASPARLNRSPSGC